MSDKVLVEDSTVNCNHSGGPTTFSPTSSRLKIAGKKVLLKADVLAASGFPGCTNTPTPSAPTLVPCTGITSVIAGESTRLKIAGAAVMLDTLSGVTNSTAPGSLTGVAAGQSRLKA